MATQFEDPAARDEEARKVEQIAREHAALAKAQDRLFQLDRVPFDLVGKLQHPALSRLFERLRLARRYSRSVRSALREKAPLSALKPEPAAAPGDSPRLSVYGRGISPRPLRTSLATDIVFDRLTAEDVAAVEAALTADERLSLDTVDPVDRRRLLLAFGVFHEVPGVLERSGLTAATPPEAVHSMGRGAAAAGGSLYYADLVADGFAAGGYAFAPGTAVLDFGCSSGRVVRALAAGYPDVEWRGCDPIGDAVTWAQENLPGIEFANSPEHPPLPYADGSLDAVYAISIWSHFNAPAATAWLEEMRRLIKPGGLLLLTTHGPQTITHDRGTRRRSEEQLSEIAAALDKDAFWYAAEFGPAGDYGVTDPDWGTAFMTAEWLLDAVTPQWKVVATAPGRVEDNQDLYVLERR